MLGYHVCLYQTDISITARSESELLFMQMYVTSILHGVGGFLMSGFEYKIVDSPFHRTFEITIISVISTIRSFLPLYVYHPLFCLQCISYLEYSCGYILKVKVGA